MRRSSANDRDTYAPGSSTDEEDDDTTPQDRKYERRDWCTTRYGDLEDHVSDRWDREGFIRSGHVVHQRGRAHNGDSRHVTNRRTPSPGATARAPLDQTEPRLEVELREADNVMAAEARPTEDPPPTSDVDADEVTLGAYGDRPLEVGTIRGGGDISLLRNH